MCACWEVQEGQEEGLLHVCVHICGQDLLLPLTCTTASKDRTLCLWSTLGAPNHMGKGGGGTTTGFIAWHQHVSTGLHAGQSHSLLLSCLKSRQGVGEGRALISILEALPSCVLSRQSSVAQQVSRHLEAPGNSNASYTQVLFL